MNDTQQPQLTTVYGVEYSYYDDMDIGQYVFTDEAEAQAHADALTAESKQRGPLLERQWYTIEFKLWTGKYADLPTEAKP